MTYDTNRIVYWESFSIFINLLQFLESLILIHIGVRKVPLSGVIVTTNKLQEPHLIFSATLVLDKLWEFSSSFSLLSISKKNSLQLLLLINSLFCDVFMLFQQKIPFSRWIKFQIGWICLRFTILRRLISTFSTETMLPNAKFLLINSIKVSVWCQIVPRSLRKYHNSQN